MMQIRCQWCGWTYTMKREEVAYAVAKAQADKAIHHVENCPKCRRALKIQVGDLKRRLPPNTPLPDIIGATAQPVADPIPPTPAPAGASTPAPAPEVTETKQAPAKKKAAQTKPKKKEEGAPTKKTTAKKTTTKKK